MVLSTHAIERLDERDIPYKLIEHCLRTGDKYIENGALKFKTDYLIIVCDINNEDNIKTIYLTNAVQKELRWMRKKYHLTLETATYLYCNQICGRINLKKCASN